MQKSANQQPQAFKIIVVTVVLSNAYIGNRRSKMYWPYKNGVSLMSTKMNFHKW